MIAQRRPRCSAKVDAPPNQSDPKKSAPKSATKSSQDLRGNHFDVLVSLEGDQFSNKERELKRSKNPLMVFSSQGYREENRKSNKGKPKEGETLSMM
ncbi:hypothetical protein Syun_025116 [Stephania yunnanensis]|uniref:Uncharacterized protein n=1 Tax=Stephania yunnanensis TaxID=152371 RepID=A0AAP0HVH4_9MAGN